MFFSISKSGLSVTINRFVFPFKIHCFVVLDIWTTYQCRDFFHFVISVKLAYAILHQQRAEQIKEGSNIMWVVNM